MDLEELWVTFDLLPNYAVSNYGRVVNVKTNRDLRPSADANGYMRVALYNKGVRHETYVHRLVAKAFFLNYEEGVEVKHKNRVFTDNTVLNLTLGEKCRKATHVQKAQRADESYSYEEYESDTGEYEIQFHIDRVLTRA